MQMTNSKPNEIQWYKERLSVVESLFAMRQRQFDLLLEITRASNHNLPLKALVAMYEQILSSQLQIQRSALVIKNGETWIRLSYKGGGDCFLNLDYNEFIKEFEVVSGIIPLSSYSQAEFEFLIPILLKGKLIAFALVGGIEEDKYDTKEEKLKLVQTLANTVCAVHENSRPTTMEVEQKVMQRDLQLASEMQRMLVPSTFQRSEHFEISTFYKPFRNIGGDYYDFFKINENSYFFCIADVSGKGVPAAMLMSNFQANIRLITQQGLPLLELVHILNGSIYTLTGGDAFITTFFGIINTETGDCEYVNAGHTTSIAVVNGEVKLLSEGCTILGAIPKLKKLISGKINLGKNALILNYTDGITESSNVAGELYGDERLVEFVAQNSHLSPELFNVKLIQSVLEFSQNDIFDDDLSLLTIAFKH